MAVSISEAAEQLGLDAGRVRRLVAQGLLEGHKVGGRWLVEESAIDERLATPPHARRSLSARSAWGLLWAAAGLPLPWLAPSEGTRARQRARSWPIDDWKWACRNRAVMHRYRAHPSVIEQLTRDERIVPSGANADHLAPGLIAAGTAEGYVPARDIGALSADYALVPSPQPNVVIRVPPPDLWPFTDRQPPWSVVVVDLLDALDDRSVRAAHDLARRMRQ